jgi:hypothetical protein
MRLFLFLVVFILAINTGYSDIAKPVIHKHEKAVLKNDTSEVNIRHFDQAALKAYSRQPEFQYKEATAGDTSLWTRFWRWFWQWIAHLFNFRSKKAGTLLVLFWKIVQIMLLLGGVAALIFFILKSQGINVLNIFQRKSAATPIPYSEFFEDINEINFDLEIENAVAKHNYRFAVRLLYLKSLKRLSDAGLIKWQIDKTNSNYISELTNEEQRAAFKLLTLQFEYVWYGEFLIDGQVYTNINTLFQNFNKRVA